MHVRMTNLRKAWSELTVRATARIVRADEGRVLRRSLPTPYRTGIFPRSNASVFGEASLLSLPLTIPGVLAATAHATPDKIAIENEDGSQLTYAELFDAYSHAVMEAVRENEKRAKANAEKAKGFDEYQQSQMTEQQNGLAPETLG